MFFFLRTPKVEKISTFFLERQKQRRSLFFYYPQNFEIGFVNHSDTPEMIRTAQAQVGWLSC